MRLSMSWACLSLPKDSQSQPINIFLGVNNLSHLQFPLSMLQSYTRRLCVWLMDVTGSAREQLLFSLFGCLSECCALQVDGGELCRVHVQHAYAHPC